MEVTPLISYAAKNSERMNAPEILFIVFSCGFVLEEFAASQEHGWAGKSCTVIGRRLLTAVVYVANAWNAFDMAYVSQARSPKLC